MAWINNYRESIELAQGATTAALALPNGSFRLTLSDAAGTRWEIVDADVVAGSATLARALEGTQDQAWPGGSVIYCDITAGQLNDLLARIEALEGGAVPAEALTDGNGEPLVDADSNYLTTEI